MQALEVPSTGSSILLTIGVFTIVLDGGVEAHRSTGSSGELLRERIHDPSSVTPDPLHIM